MEFKLNEEYFNASVESVLRHIHIPMANASDTVRTIMLVVGLRISYHF
jgi:hypothetical protein